MGATYNMLKTKSIGGALGVLFAIMLSSHIVTAQSTLFNIPSTDVVSKKKTYVEFDFVSHLEAYKDGGFQTYVPRIVFGVGKHIEIGTNVAFTKALLPDQPLVRRVSFVMDWLSGKNRFGYVTPGLSFTVSKTSALYAGYSIGNSGRKNNALFIYYGITF